MGGLVGRTCFLVPRLGGLVFPVYRLFFRVVVEMDRWNWSLSWWSWNFCRLGKVMVIVRVVVVIVAAVIVGITILGSHGTIMHIVGFT